MGSTVRDRLFLDSRGNPQLYTLDYRTSRAFHFCAAALTAKHRFAARRYAADWDIDLKRNAALLYAKDNGFRTILLLDDDIRDLTEQHVTTACSLLHHYHLVGSFVDDSPDISTVDHVLRVLDVNYEPFVSGSCLFADVRKVDSFFPPIYNEDWFFLAKEVVAGRVAAVGAVRQEPYDPFFDVRRPVMQEFGDVLASGLYNHLSHGGALWDDILLSTAYWADHLSRRKELFEHVKNAIIADPPDHHVPRTLKMLRAANCILSQIRPEDCLTFLKALRRDNDSWSAYITR